MTGIVFADATASRTNPVAGAIPEIRPTVAALERLKARYKDRGLGDVIALRPYDIVDNDGMPIRVYCHIPLDREGTKSRSKEAAECLDWLSERDGIPILHGKAGDGAASKEIRLQIGRPRAGMHEWVNIDGFDPTTLTIYEYNGDKYHPTILSGPIGVGEGLETQKAAEKYDIQETKRWRLTGCGFRVHEISSSDYGRMRRKAAGKRGRRTQSSLAAESVPVASIPTPLPVRQPEIDAVTLSRYQALRDLTAGRNLVESVDAISKMRYPPGALTSFTFAPGHSPISFEHYISYQRLGCYFLGYFGDKMLRSKSVRRMKSEVSAERRIELVAFIEAQSVEKMEEMRRELQYSKTKPRGDGWTWIRAKKLLAGFLWSFYGLKVTHEGAMIQMHGPKRFE